MHRIICAILTSLMAAVFFPGCQTLGPGAASGGALGTFAGGLTGAAIGARDGKTSEGALIGALTGGTLGTMAGNSIDRQIEQDQIEYQQQQQTRNQAAVSIEQVLQMTRSGLPDDVIVRQIQNQGIRRRATIDDLIVLKNQGVNDSVIQAFQNASIASLESPVVVRQPVEVIRQPIFYDPCLPVDYGYGFRYRKRGCGPRAGFSINF